ncbi:MAG: metallophosphoesterase, partial [Pseudomonadales bacterium]|nr:metallophosphoesterase [Pseudomonadales bacterium]
MKNKQLHNKQPSDERASGVNISRRTFLHNSLLTGGAVASAGALGVFQTLTTMRVAHAAAEPFSFAWVSDTHLYPKTLNTRFVEKAARAFQDIQAQADSFDFMIFGGDLAQKGDPVELELGAEMLSEITVKKLFIPGEHDWYLDMGDKWNQLFGESPWVMDHKGVRIIGLNTVGYAPDYWTAKGMSPTERMAHMEALDGSQAGPWSGLGKQQLEWLATTLSDWPKDQPVIIFSHTPLYEYYPGWNFWVRDWRQVHEIILPFSNLTNIHGHVHQPLYHEVDSVRFIGQLATSWPWPYAPEGVPALTKPMIRVDPGDPFDGVGWGQIAMTDSGAEQEYKMWRNEVF